jgi:protein-tyrosine phosphatase
MDENLELYSEVLPNLFIGGTHDEDTVEFPQELKNLHEREEFDAVVTCYSYAQPMSWYVHENRFGFADGPMDIETFNKVIELSDWLYEKWQSGAKCLSRCQMGYNRSGIVLGALLIKHGYTAEEAIHLIRQKRSPHALNNLSFLYWLRKYEQRKSA